MAKDGAASSQKEATRPLDHGEVPAAENILGRARAGTKGKDLGNQSRTTTGKNKMADGWTTQKKDPQAKTCGKITSPAAAAWDSRRSNVHKPTSTRRSSKLNQMRDS